MIAREGVLWVGGAAVAAGAGIHLGAWPLAGAGVAGVVLLSWVFFERRAAVPSFPNGVLAPVTGVVTRTDGVDDPFLDRRAQRVRIEVRVPGIGEIRTPSEGKIMEFWTRSAPLGSDADDASFASPNCYAVWVRTDEEDDVVHAVSSRRPVSRFKLDAAPGERSGQGRRSGYVYFASFVDVLMPRDASFTAAPGDAVRAGETPIGEFRRGA